MNSHFHIFYQAFSEAQKNQKPKTKPTKQQTKQTNHHWVVTMGAREKGQSRLSLWDMLVYTRRLEREFRTEQDSPKYESKGARAEASVSSALASEDEVRGRHQVSSSIPLHLNFKTAFH